MSCRYRLPLLLAVSCLTLLAGCGGGGSSGFAPNISGPFSNASLNGLYAISFTGTNQFGFLAVVGSFTANGGGSITSGVADINSGNGVFTNQALSGSYTVRSNGQGTATISTAAGTFDFNFVIINNQRARVVRFDNNSSASGSIDAQSSSAFATVALGGTFAFNLGGIDAAGHNFITVGAIDPNGAGGIGSGVQDSNDNGIPSTNLPVTGTYGIGAGPNGRGVLSLNTTTGTLSFVIYIVDGNHFKMLEVDRVPVLVGDAFRQQFPQSTASVSGPFAFTIGGSTTGDFPLVAGGVLSTDGVGHISSGTQDINNNGTVSQGFAVTGTYSVGADGRGSLSLTGVTGTSNFIIYPTTNGVQMIQVDVGTATSGAALSQTGSFSNASFQGTYGMNWTGAAPAGEVDSAGQFSANGSGSLTGAMDLNNVGALTSGLALSGSYSIAANGRGTGTFQSSFGTQHIIFYTVSAGKALFIETDSNLVAVGDFEHQ